MRKYPMLLYFVGQNELISNSGEGHKILNVCMQSRIVYHNLSLDEEGRMHLWCTPYMAYILRRECERLGVALTSGRNRGLPHIINRYKNRAGFLVGAICAIMMMLAADNYIWDIRITGNETVTYTELSETLSECGLRVGSRISELDVDAIETITVLNCKKISWITINIQGTHANVQIREVGERPSGEEKTKPSNLVAARDGQIDRLELFSGNAMVRNGDVVRAGDILVSGVWDSNHYGMFITRSSGKVFARTTRTFKIEIPFEYEEKVLTERKIKEKYLIFFSKEIKVFENAGNMGSSCDTIESVENLRFFNGDRLPVGVRTVSELYYTNEARRYTETEAMNIAYYRLGEQIKNELFEAELIRKTVECEITDNAYILYCTVECIEDIAVMREFDYVTPN